VAIKDLQVVHSGERTNARESQRQQKLLSISDRDYSSLRPHLEYVSLPSHLVLHEAGEKLECAYFPNRGLISLVVVMKNGKNCRSRHSWQRGLHGTLAAVGVTMNPVPGRDAIAGMDFGSRSELCKMLWNPLHICN